MSVAQQIQQSQAQLSSLNSTISGLQTSMSSAQGRLAMYQRRLSQVRAIKSSLGSTFTYQIDSINLNQTAARNGFEHAIEGYSHRDTLIDLIHADTEQLTNVDDHGVEMHSNLQSEIVRCEGEIDSAQAEIDRCSKQIDSCQSRRDSLNDRITKLRREQ